MPQKHTFGQQEKTMKKNGKCKRWIPPQQIEPEYIVLNEHASVFVGLIGGDLNFSTDILNAKCLRGQEKFNMLQRASYFKIEQMFI